MDIVLLASAENDLQEGYNRYEDLREGLGEVYLEFVEAGLDQISQFPQSAPIINERYRRLLVKQFPYGIIYTIQPTRIIVLGVMDPTRDPDRIDERLS